MAEDNSGVKKMGGYAIATVALAAITLTGLAVVQGYKDTGIVDNTTADAFIAGLAIFGTFMVVITLSLVGKIIIGIFKGGY